MGRLLSACLLASPLAALSPMQSAWATQLPTDTEASLRAGAWDASVAMERQGNLAGARQRLLAAWGPAPDSYELTLRLAWLSLRMGDQPRAISYYRRARTLDGAGQEATRGLASALTAQGYAQLEEGDLSEARGSFEEALRVQPEHADAQRGMRLSRSRSVSAELWLGAYAQRGDDIERDGGLAFAALRLRPTERWRLTLAYRFQSYGEPVVESVGAGNAGVGNATRQVERTLRTQQHEAYAGGGFEAQWWGAEAMGLSIWRQREDTVYGQAARLRIGQRAGIETTQALLSSDSYSSLQLSPRGYLWAIPQFGVWAGVLVTHDDVDTSAAAVFGLTTLVAPLELYVSALAGRSRWPVSVAIPSVLTLTGDIRYGGTATALVAISEVVALGLNAELYRFEPAGSATYAGTAVGLRLSPRF